VEYTVGICAKQYKTNSISEDLESFSFYTAFLLIMINSFLYARRRTTAYYGLVLYGVTTGAASRTDSEVFAQYLK
jgi:hypothetical protein